MCFCAQDGWTALHLAAYEGKVDVVRLLLTDAQAQINIQTKVKWIPTYFNNSTSNWQCPYIASVIFSCGHVDYNVLMAIATG